MEAPMDFDAEHAKNRAAYQTCMITFEQYEERVMTLMSAEMAFEIDKEIVGELISLALVEKATKK